jgi:hypothetical protein
VEVYSREYWYVACPDLSVSNKQCFFTSHYLEKYLMFIEWVQGQNDWSKIKYLDESHFVSRQLKNGKVWGLREKRVYTRENSLNDPSSSVTLILSLGPNKPLFYDIRIENNDQVMSF